MIENNEKRIEMVNEGKIVSGDDERSEGKVELGKKEKK